MTTDSVDSEVVLRQCESEKCDRCEPSVGISFEAAVSCDVAVPDFLSVSDNGFHGETCDVTVDDGSACLPVASCSVECKSKNESIVQEYDVAKFENGAAEHEAVTAPCSTSVEGEPFDGIVMNSLNKGTFPETPDNGRQSARTTTNGKSESLANSTTQMYGDFQKKECANILETKSELHCAPVKSELQFHILEVQHELADVSKSTGHLDESRNDTNVEQCVSMYAQRNVSGSVERFSTTLNRLTVEEHTPELDNCTDPIPVFLSHAESVAKATDSTPNFGEGVVEDEKFGGLLDFEEQRKVNISEDACIDISKTVGTDSVIQNQFINETNDIKDCVPFEDNNLLETSRRRAELNSSDMSTFEDSGINSCSLYCLPTESATTSNGNSDDFSSALEMFRPKPCNVDLVVTHTSFSDSLSENHSFEEAAPAIQENSFCISDVQRSDESFEIACSGEANFINPESVLSHEQLANDSSKIESASSSDFRIDPSKDSSELSALKQKYRGGDPSILRPVPNELVCVSDVDSSVDVLEADSNLNDNLVSKGVSRDENCTVSGSLSCEVVNSSLSDVEVSSTSDGPMIFTHQKLYLRDNHDDDLPYSGAQCHVEDNFCQGSGSWVAGLSMTESEYCSSAAAELSSKDSSSPKVASTLGNISQFQHQCVSKSMLDSVEESSSRETFVPNVSSSSKMSFIFEDQSHPEFDHISEDHPVHTTVCATKDQISRTSSSVLNPDSLSEEPVCSNSVQTSDKPDFGGNILGRKSSSDLGIKLVCLKSHDELQSQPPSASNNSGFCVDNDDSFVGTSAIVMEPVAKVSTFIDSSLPKAPESCNFIAEEILAKNIYSTEETVYSSVALGNCAMSLSKVQDEETGVISSSETAALHMTEMMGIENDAHLRLSEPTDEKSERGNVTLEISLHKNIPNKILTQTELCDITEIRKCFVRDLPVRITDYTRELNVADEANAVDNDDDVCQISSVIINEIGDQHLNIDNSDVTSRDFTKAYDTNAGVVSSEISDECAHQSIEKTDEIFEVVEAKLDRNLETLFPVSEIIVDRLEAKSTSAFGTDLNFGKFSNKFQDLAEQKVNSEDFSCGNKQKSDSELQKNKDEGMNPHLKNHENVFWEMKGKEECVNKLHLEQERESIFNETVKEKEYDEKVKESTSTIDIESEFAVRQNSPRDKFGKKCDIGRKCDVFNLLLNLQKNQEDAEGGENVLEKMAESTEQRFVHENKTDQEFTSTSMGYEGEASEQKYKSIVESNATQIEQTVNECLHIGQIQECNESKEQRTESTVIQEIEQECNETIALEISSICSIQCDSEAMRTVVEVPDKRRSCGQEVNLDVEVTQGADDEQQCDQGTCKILEHQQGYQGLEEQESKDLKVKELIDSKILTEKSYGQECNETDNLEQNFGRKVGDEDGNMDNAEPESNCIAEIKHEVVSNVEATEVSLAGELVLEKHETEKCEIKNDIGEGAEQERRQQWNEKLIQGCKLMKAEQQLEQKAGREVQDVHILEERQNLNMSEHVCCPTPKQELDIVEQDQNKADENLREYFQMAGYSDELIQNTEDELLKKRLGEQRQNENFVIEPEKKAKEIEQYNEIIDSEQKMERKNVLFQKRSQTLRIKQKHYGKTGFKEESIHEEKMNEGIVEDDIFVDEHRQREKAVLMIKENNSTHPGGIFEYRSNEEKEQCFEIDLRKIAKQEIGKDETGSILEQPAEQLELPKQNTTTKRELEYCVNETVSVTYSANSRELGSKVLGLEEFELETNSHVNFPDEEETPRPCDLSSVTGTNYKVEMGQNIEAYLKTDNETEKENASKIQMSNNDIITCPDVMVTLPCEDRMVKTYECTDDCLLQKVLLDYSEGSRAASAKGRRGPGKKARGDDASREKVILNYIKRNYSLSRKDCHNTVTELSNAECESDLEKGNRISVEQELSLVNALIEANAEANLSSNDRVAKASGCGDVAPEDAEPDVRNKAADVVECSQSIASKAPSKTLMSSKDSNCSTVAVDGKISKDIVKLTEHFTNEKIKNRNGRRKPKTGKNTCRIIQKIQTEERDNTAVDNRADAIELPHKDISESAVNDLSLSKGDRCKEECATAVKKSGKMKKGNKTGDVSHYDEELSKDLVPLDYRKPPEPSPSLQSVDLVKDSKQESISVENGDTLNDKCNSEAANKCSYWEAMCYENSTLSDPSLSSIRQLEECVKAISTSLQNCINNSAAYRIDSFSDYSQKADLSKSWMLGPDFNLQNDDSLMRNFSPKSERLPGEKSKSKCNGLKVRRNSNCLKQEQEYADLNKLPWIGSKKGSKKKITVQIDPSNPVFQGDLQILQEEVKSVKDINRKKRRGKKNEASFALQCVSTNINAVPMESEKGHSMDFATDLSKKSLKVSLENCNPVLQMTTNETPKQRMNDLLSTNETPKQRMNDLLSVAADVQSNLKKQAKHSRKKSKEVGQVLSYNSAETEGRNLLVSKEVPDSSDSSNKQSKITAIADKEMENNLMKFQVETEQLTQESLPKKSAKKRKSPKAAKMPSDFSSDASGTLLVDPNEKLIPKKKMKRSSEIESNEIMQPMTGSEAHLLADKPKKKSKMSKKGKHNLEKISPEEKLLSTVQLPDAKLATFQSYVADEPVKGQKSEDLPVHSSSCTEFLQEDKGSSGVGRITSTDAKPGESEAGEHKLCDSSESKCAIINRADGQFQKTPSDFGSGKVSSSYLKTHCDENNLGTLVNQDPVTYDRISSADTKPFACPQCSYRAKKKGQLRKHLGVHHIHGCAHCDFTCGTHEELEDHMLAHHPSRCGRKLCKRCHVLFRIDCLDVHERECTGEKRGWDCQECGKKFKFVSAMRTHLKRWHSNCSMPKSGNEEEKDDTTEKSVFGISVFNEMQMGRSRPDDAEPYKQLTISDSNSNSNKHLDSFQPTKASSPLLSPGRSPSSSHIDVSCLNNSSESLKSLSHPPKITANMTFNASTADLQSSDDSTRHAGIVASQSNSEITENSLSLLESTFSKLSSPLANKLEIVTESEITAPHPPSEKPFICTICQKFFKSKKTLTSHSLANHGLKPDLPCRKSSKIPPRVVPRPSEPEEPKQDDSDETLCSKTSVDGSNVVFTCFFQECRRQFKKLEQLHKHEEKHSVDKPHKCDWSGCRKSFLHLNNLTLHRQHHTEAKPFPCDRCSLGYWQKCSLKSHQLKIHGNTGDSGTEVESAKPSATTENPESKSQEDVDESDSKSTEKVAATSSSSGSKELNIYEFCESEEEEELVKLNARPSSTGRFKAAVLPKENVTETSLLSTTDDELSVSDRTSLEKPLKTYLKTRKPKSKDQLSEFEMDGDQQETNLAEFVLDRVNENGLGCVETEAENDIGLSVTPHETSRSVKKRKRPKAVAERQRTNEEGEDEEEREMKAFTKRRKYVAAVDEKKIVIKAVLPKVKKIAKKKSKKIRKEAVVEESIKNQDKQCSVQKSVKSGVLRATSKKTRLKKTSSPALKTVVLKSSYEQNKAVTEVPRRGRNNLRSEVKATDTNVAVQLSGRGKKRKVEAQDDEVNGPQAKKKCVVKQIKPAEARGKKIKNKRTRRKEKRKKPVAKRKASNKVAGKTKKKAVELVDDESSLERNVCDVVNHLTEESNEEDKVKELDCQEVMNAEVSHKEQENQPFEGQNRTEQDSEIEQDKKVENDEEDEEAAENVATEDRFEEETEDELDDYSADKEYSPVYDHKKVSETMRIVCSEDEASVEIAELGTVREDIANVYDEVQREEGDKTEEVFDDIEDKNEECENGEIEKDDEEFDGEKEVDKSENGDGEDDEEAEELGRKPNQGFVESPSDRGENALDPSTSYAQHMNIGYDNFHFRDDDEESRYQMNQQGSGSETDENCSPRDILMPGDYHPRKLLAKVQVDESDMQSSLAVPVIVSQVQPCHEPPETPSSPAVGAKQANTEEQDYNSVCGNSYDIACHRYSDAEVMYGRHSTSPNENHSTDSQHGETQSLLTDSYPVHYPLLPVRPDHNPLQSLEGLASGGPPRSISATFFDTNTKTLSEQVGKSLTVGYGENQPSPTYAVPPTPFSIEQTSLERSQDFSYAAGGRNDPKFAQLQLYEDGTPRSAALCTDLPSSNAISRDFFGQYFQEPSPLSISQDQRSQGFAGRQSGLSSFQRSNTEFFRCNPSALLPPSTPYSAVSESLLGMKHSQIRQSSPTAQTQHWPGHEDRTRPWDHVSPMITQSDNGQRNLYSTAARTDYSLESSGPSIQSTKRMESSFRGMSPSVLGQPDLYGVPGPYSLAYSPSAGGVSYSRTLPASQKQLEEAYRHAAAAHISDYRTFSAPAHHTPLPDVYGAMGINSTLSEFDRYYYSARDAMYRSQQLASAMPHPFMQQGSAAPQMGMSYADRSTYGREPVYGQPSPYGFMCDKQYLSPANTGNGKMVQGSSTTSDYLHVPVDQQDPYRRSVIYNMMPRYF